MGLFKSYQAYVLYFPMGLSYKTAGHELAAMTTMKSLQRGLIAPTVRYVLGNDEMSNYKRDTCELNEQSCIRIDSHAKGKKDSKDNWSGTCTKSSVIDALTRGTMANFRVRSTTGNISINFGPPPSKVTGSNFGLSALAKGLVPGLDLGIQAFGVAATLSNVIPAPDTARTGARVGRGAIARVKQTIIFYMEALQSVRTPLSISCPEEGVSCLEIARFLHHLDHGPTGFPRSTNLAAFNSDELDGENY